MIGLVNLLGLRGVLFWWKSIALEKRQSKSYSLKCDLKEQDERTKGAQRTVHLGRAEASMSVMGAQRRSESGF